MLAMLLFDKACPTFSDLKRYPTVLLDASSYPYVPEVKKHIDIKDPKLIKSLTRLTSYSKKEIKIEKNLASMSVESKIKQPNRALKRDSLESNASSSLKSPENTDSHFHDSSPESPEPKFGERQFVVERKSHLPPTKEELIAQAKIREKMLDPNLSRTDVKQTLKSMGLKCEDFTISVYSREQAHAILRKQGVEVTNHGPPMASTYRGAAYRAGFVKQQGGRGGLSTILPPSVSVLRPETSKTTGPAAATIGPPPLKKKADEEDDDDCIILDPPEGVKPPRPTLPPPPPVRRLPQQFQLMGTTVQVNRGAKRPMRGMPRFAPFAKRQFRQPHPSLYGGYAEGDTHQEASVQDTLKRLKNYNISITCRRNSSGSGETRKGHRDGSDDEEMDHKGDRTMDSEDEEDLAKYLECEIDESMRVQMEEEEEEEDDPMESSGSIADVQSSSADESTPRKTPHTKEGEELKKTSDAEEENKSEESKKSIPEKEAATEGDSEDAKEEKSNKDKEPNIQEDEENVKEDKNEINDINKDKSLSSNKGQNLFNSKGKQKQESSSSNVVQKETKSVSGISQGSNKVRNTSVPSTIKDLNKKGTPPPIIAPKPTKDPIKISHLIKPLPIRTTEDESLLENANISEPRENNKMNDDHDEGPIKNNKGVMEDEEINEELENQLLGATVEGEMESENVDHYLDLESDL